jgi:anti-sigma regulatory factor (Ser/Thr protein kinase)
MDSGEVFELEIPLEPAFFVCARLFAGALARFYESDHAATEDVKIAVSEACSNALAKKPPPTGPIRISVKRQPGELSFEIENGGAAIMDDTPGDSGAEHASTEELARILGVELIRSLFPDAAVHRNNGGHDLTFSLATPS